MPYQGYIKELELRLEHATEQQRNMQTTLSAILIERAAERAQYDSRETEKRDFFAAEAMNGLLASCSDQIVDCPEPTRIAEIAYKVADAMVAERNKQP